MPKNRADVRRALLESVFWNDRSNASDIAREFGLTPQAVQYHARTLIQNGLLESRGTTRWRRYQLKHLDECKKVFSLRGKPSEDLVWNAVIRDGVSDLHANEKDIL